MNEMEELVIQAKLGNNDAFNKLINSIYPDLIKYATSRLRNKSYADDVVQNSIIIAYIKIIDLKYNNKFKSWIYKIVKNQCILANKKLKDYAENNLEFDENISDPSFKIDSKINFEDIISRLDDDEKKLLKMKFEHEYSYHEISDELGIPYNTIKSKINRTLKKISLLLIILIVLSGFTTLASYIIKTIKAHFTTSLNAIDSAVENDFVQEIDGEFIYSNNIGIKVDALVLDDKNLAISFVYDVKDKEKYGNITGIGLNDFTIKDELGNLIFEMNKRKNNSATYILQYPDNIENIDDYYFKNSILLSTINSNSEINNILLEINSININTEVKENYKTINGFWKLKYDISDLFNNRSKETYILENNSLVDYCDIILTDTSIQFSLKLKEKISIYSALHTTLSNNYNKFKIIDYSFAEQNNKLDISFDLGKYTENIENLTLEIPLENNETITLKFKRDL